MIAIIDYGAGNLFKGGSRRLGGGNPVSLRFPEISLSMLIRENTA